MLSVPRGADLKARLTAHTGGYPARLEESLREAYPAIAHALGDGAFADLARRYTAASPPRSFNLNDAGRSLAAFLERDEASRQLPFLADLARLEWALVEAFHAPTEPPFDLASATAWSLDQWENATLRFQPWVRLVRSRWPVRLVWEARDTPIAEIDIDLSRGPEALLIRRHGFSPECETIGADEATAIEALRSGRTLGTFSSELAARGHKADAISAWFRRWAAANMIAACGPSACSPTTGAQA